MVEADYTGVLLDGRYRIQARRGQGGMGTVYVAEHVGLAQPRAIKFLRADLARKPGAIQRFLQEARVLSAMRHDNLVGVIDMGQHAGSAYYVMELLAGEDLRGRLRRLGGLGWPETRAIALQVCAALRMTHARGVVHRDLKPENCFCVAAPGDAVHIKLIDFGVAKVPREAGGASQLTGAGELLGTIGYMAPEQLEGQGDRRADIYSLGAMMFEMLAGRPLHTGNAYEILAHMLLAPAPALASVIAVDPAIDRLLATAVARDPDQRFASMDAFAAAIAEIPVTAAPQTFDRPASALASPAGETTAGGTPVPGDMFSGAGPEDLRSADPHLPRHIGGVDARAHGPPAHDAPTPAHTRVPQPPVPADSSVITEHARETSSVVPEAPVREASSAAPGDVPGASSPAAAKHPVRAELFAAPEAPVPADSSTATSRGRAAVLLAAVLLAAVIAWRVWPVDEVSNTTPAPSSPAAAATVLTPATDPFEPVPSASPEASRVPPVPAASSGGPLAPVSAASSAPPSKPVPAASSAAPPASRPAPVKPRDAAKPAPAVRPLTREALRDRLARELAACGSPYVAEEIAVRVTPGKAGKLAGLAPIADARLAPGTVDCLERQLARVLAGLVEGVDAELAFDVSLKLPRRGGG